MEGSDTTEQEHMETTEVITLQLALYHIHVYACSAVRSLEVLYGTTSD